MKTAETVLRTNTNLQTSKHTQQQNTNASRRRHGKSQHFGVKMCAGVQFISTQLTAGRAAPIQHKAFESGFTTMVTADRNNKYNNTNEHTKTHKQYKKQKQSKTQKRYYERQCVC